MSKKKPAPKKAAPEKVAGPATSEEAAFLAGLAAHPDDDAPRLALADWLQEHDRPSEAELIRVQCELEPLRERHGEPRTEELGERERALYWPLRSAHIDWLGKLTGRAAYEIEFRYRRGFVEELHLPVQWVIAHGAAIRARFPLLRKLAVFRLNGWGERLAACEHLRGLRELDLAGWYSDADAEALARSPHLGDLEVLTYWHGGWQGGSADGQLVTLAAAKAWPKLRALRVMHGLPPHAALANAAAGREIAEAIDPNDWLFPFRADFGGNCFFIGKLPDGRQIFSGDADDDGSAQAVVFTATGDVIEQRPIEFPPDTLTRREKKPPKDWAAQREKEEAQREKRLRHLRDALGFEPGFIRVRGFRIGDIGPSRYRNRVEDAIGATDDPAVPPEQDNDSVLGEGRLVYEWVTGGAFLFMYGNDWWCDGTGCVTST